jgi:glucose 1-dehydrogenase
MRSMVGRAIKDFGHLDYLVANAGVTHFAPFLSASEEDFNAVIDVNLRGTFFLVQAAANAMDGLGGSIVLMSSNISNRAYPNLTAYSMSKAAINMMARSLSLELGPLGININALAPGATLTERTAREGKDYAGTWSRLIPTGRVAQPEDIARATIFLLSSAARQISGTVLVVDGGWSGVARHPQ